VLLVIILIFLSQRFVQFIGKAAAGKLEVDAVLLLMAMQLPVLVAFLMPMAIFLGTLMALGRMYVDQEFAILKACGVSETQLAKKLAFPVTLLTLLTLYLSLHLAPWASSAQYQLVDEQAAKNEVGLLAAGQFKQTSDGRGTFYLKQLDEKGNMTDVFYAVKNQDKDSYSVVTAQGGKIVSSENGRALVLENGKQYEGDMKSQQLNVSEFATYILRLPEPEIQQRKLKLKAVSSMALLHRGDHADIAELQWRFSIPISLMLLVLIAIPLAQVRPRQGKFAKLLPALGIYLVYMVGLLGAKSLVESGKLPTFPGVFIVHVLMGFYIIKLYSKESNTWVRFIRRGES
jgi:lipopolysaccharide export system permease protein